MNGRWYAVAGVGFAGAALAASLTGAADGAVQSPGAAGKSVSKAQVTAIAKKQANKQANRVVTARAPQLSVATAAQAAPTGVAGGGLTGTYPNPEVAPGSITAAKLAAASVETAALRDGSVTTDKLADQSVTTGKLAGPIVASRNLMDGSVRAHALGPITVDSDAMSVLPGETGAATISCPAGYRLITGGGSASSVDLHLVSSYPTTQDSWRVVYVNTGGSTRFYSVVASCLEPMGG